MTLKLSVINQLFVLNKLVIYIKYYTEIIIYNNLTLQHFSVISMLVFLKNKHGYY